MTKQHTIEITEEGTPTLRHPLFGDTYHSMRGAVGESTHVFIGNGLKAAVTDGVAQPVNVLEVGFGSGLNAWLTAKYAQQEDIKIQYTALELYPVPQRVITKLSYASDSVFCDLHAVRWGEWVDVTPVFSIKKVECDLVDVKFDTTFDVIYFDAFAADTQPEMWSQGIFDKLFAATREHGILVTYSAKGDVKRALRGAGYSVERLQGALGKRHMIRARKNLKE